jgi:hypothetical protein
MTRLKYRALLLVALAAFVPACGGSDTDLVTPPTPPNITEPLFTGTLTPNGAATQFFAATSFGTATLTIVSLDPNPDNTVRVGLALGTWNAQLNTCSVQISNDTAGLNTAVFGSVSRAGNLCARTYDTGRLTEPVNFEIRIEHP